MLEQRDINRNRTLSHDKHIQPCMKNSKSKISVRTVTLIELPLATEKDTFGGFPKERRLESHEI